MENPFTIGVHEEPCISFRCISTLRQNLSPVPIRWSQSGRPLGGGMPEVYVLASVPCAPLLRHVDEESWSRTWIEAVTRGIGDVNSARVANSSQPCWEEMRVLRTFQSD